MVLATFYKSFTRSPTMAPKILHKSETLPQTLPHSCKTNRLMLYIWVLLNHQIGNPVKHLLILLSFLLRTCTARV